jgi:hypothetical protein
VFTRLRQDVHRTRLFVELEPEVAWRLDAPGVRRRRMFAITARLELHIISRRL